MVEVAGRVPVLVVGGGPVGLAMGLALDRFGVACLVAERSPTTTDHPKSRGCWVRTMEVLRGWGVEPAVRARGLAERTDVFAYLEASTAVELGRTRPEPRGDQSPTWKSLVAQDAVEEELLAALRAGPGHADVRFSTEVVEVVDHGDRVQARLVDLRNGTDEWWEADWVVAADGAGSGTRRAVGIEMVGPACLAVMLNEYVRADLSSLPVAKEAAVIMVVPPEGGPPSLGLLNTNGRDRWLLVTRIGADRDERPRPYDDEEVGALLRSYVGLDDLEVTRLSTSTWRMSRQVAARFRQGRVLLAGDAAHRFPPTGGFGLNTGVQDAHNLAWKLAFVLRGHASERLLDSYDAERRPVAESNADFSLRNLGRMPLVERAVRSGDPDRIAFWMDDLDGHLHSVGQSLGFRYEAGALVPDGSTPPASDPRRYEPVDRPGSRFPHLWLDDGRSTLDWFDHELVVVAGEDGQAWVAVAEEVARRRRLPLVGRVLPRGRARAAGCRCGARGAVLVRPDGHVAWRLPHLPADPPAELGAALDTVLA